MVHKIMFLVMVYITGKSLIDILCNGSLSSTI